MPDAAPHKTRIVILGGGFGGAYCAQMLEKTARKLDAEVVLINQHNYFIFYPLLIEAGTGTIEPRHAVVSLRSFLTSTEFRMGSVKSVDTDLRRVTYDVDGMAAAEVTYDHLVLALGGVTRLPDVPGLREFGFELKSLADAVLLRDRAIGMLEMTDAITNAAKRRELLHFVVVGGNFSGAELAGEFHAFLREASRCYRNIKPADCQVTLIEVQDRILSALDPDLSEFAATAMRRRGINILLKTTVQSVAEDHVVLSTGEKLLTQTVIWCAGVAPNPIIKHLSFPVDGRGYIVCERDLRVKSFANVWGIGDCAVNLGPDGKPYPATAQHAVQEARHLAQNLVRVLRNQPPLPCNIQTKGSIAALGCRTGVAKVFGIKISGILAWFLFRTFYLMRMPSWTRRLRIAIDWTIHAIFPREYVQLGVHRRPNKSAR